MMFSGEAYCRVTARWERQEEAPFCAGQAKALNLAVVEAGLVALAGAALFLPAGSLLVGWGPLSLEPAGAASLRGLALAGEAAAAFAEALPEAVALPPGACPEAAELLARLAQPQGAARESAAAFALLCLLAEAPQDGPALPALVAEALGHMHSHYGEVYGVEELAEELGVSKGHLIRSFSAALGMPPGRYLSLVRMDAAKRLLLQGLALDTVAGLCGFSGANYLCRVFKKATGLSPAAWQKKNAARPSALPARQEVWDETMYL